ncbi:hypothetical protein BC567DRAFT_205563 [Phyllosticta citribraziliensis]
MSTDSPSSFVTAVEGDTTVYLTPPPTSHPPQNRVPDSQPVPHFYRPPKQLPFELSSHACIFLASGQYIEGLELLKSLLISGGSISSPSNPRPAFIPPTQIFELAATLAVHPSTTTRASAIVKVRAANEALLYLRAVNRKVGPINAGFANAFTFSRARNGKRRGFFDPNNSARKDGQNAAESRPLHSALANGSSVWERAHDFWHVVGWAFNCSIKHKARWSRWQVWLEVMLEIMEDDWRNRQKKYQQELQDRGVSSAEIMTKGIMPTYLTSCEAWMASSRRRILRAIFADGSERSLAHFQEVFEDELRERAKPKPDSIKAADFQTADLDALDPDEDEDLIEESTPPTRKSSRPGAKADRRPSIITISSDNSITPENANIAIAEPFGPPAALALRVRLLSLLGDVTLALPTTTTTRERLFDTYTEFLRPLPITSFTTMLSALAAHLPPATFCILAANTLLPLISTTPETYHLDAPSQDEWEFYFLPIAAATSSVTDNAKVSALLRFVVQVSLPEITWRRGWAEAVFKGIKARHDKIEAGRLNGRGRGRGSGRGDHVVEGVLRDCESTLMCLVGWVEDDANVPSDQRPPRPEEVITAPPPAANVVDLGSFDSEELSDIPEDLDTPETNQGED